MQLKDDSIELYGLRPELVTALIIANDVWSAEGVPLVITSVSDGRHSNTSLHYAGCAVDLRSRTLQDPHATALKLKQYLNQDFDVIVEPTHIHLEYQPRRR